MEKTLKDHNYSVRGPNVGMSDNELIGYAWFHARTPRGMFTKHQVSRLIFLAGSPTNSMSPEEYLAEKNDWVYCGEQYSRANEWLLGIIELAEKIRDKKLISA